MEVSLQPRNISLVLLGKCNYRCNFCRIALNLDDKKRELLTPDNVSRIIEYFPDARKYRIGAMCEPTISPYIGGVVRTIVSSNKSLYFTTNGSRILHIFDEVPWDRIDIINVSLNEINNKDYERTTGRKCFHRVIEGIKKLSLSGANIGVSYVMHKNNYDKVVDYVDFAKGLGVSRVSLILFVEPLKYNNVQSVEDFVSYQDRAMNELFSRKHDVESIGLKVQWPRFVDVKKPLIKNPCIQARMRIDIDGDGNVALCCGGEGPRPEMGNIFEQGPSVYGTGPMKKLRNRILGPPNDRPSKCKSCRSNYEKTKV